MPSRRYCSIERALVLLHFGCCVVSFFSVTRIAGMPRQASSIAAVSPIGPPPTIKTQVSVAGIMLRSLESCTHKDVLGLQNACVRTVIRAERRMLIGLRTAPSVLAGGQVTLTEPAIA